MSRTRALLAAMAPLVCHALARELDRALGLVLRAETDPVSLPREVGRALAADAAAAGLRLGLWVAGGAVAGLLILFRVRRGREPLVDGLPQIGALLAPLWLRPALTLVALLAVALSPGYPYALTFPVALTQDWSWGQDAAALATMVAIVSWRGERPRLPVPRSGELFLIVFLGYASLAPDWAFRWEGHPGNEPKYLRQAVALGLFGSFDAEGVSGPMETLPARGALDVLSGAVRTAASESGAMLTAAWRGDAGRDAIRATRITRQTVRGKQGGVFYVLAPGPSLLLAPTLRADRALNLGRGESGRVALSTLAWCALGALLIVAVRGLLADATGQAGLATLLAFGVALLPPFLFYFYQYYPEMVGALVLAVAFRTLALRPAALARHPWLVGWLLASLPWLHQKFLPTWAVLTLTALAVAWRSGAARLDRDRRAALGCLAGLLVPQALSAYLTALYNFAITGSVRPDALFLAWGPGGVTSARVGQGLLGLLLDARFGIVPYVPLLLLAPAGLLRGGARRLAVVWPAAAAYYLTVASADNWSGAVCNLGRYFMPLAPLAAALVAIALARETGGDKPVDSRRAAAALALALAAWSALFALALWRDPQAANDSGLLLSRSEWADAHQYLPDLFIRRWSDAAPGLFARVGAWLLAVLLLAAGLRRAASASRALAGTAAVALALALVLERWPGARTAPAHVDALVAPAPAAGDTLVFCDGAARVREDEAVVGPGDVTLTVRQRLAAGVRPAATLPAIVGGEGVLAIAGQPRLLLRRAGALLELPLITYHEVDGSDGRRAVFARLRATVTGQAVVRFAGSRQPAPPSAPAGAAPVDDPAQE